MARDRSRRKTPPTAVAPGLVLVLYIANGAPNSLRAQANLKAICGEYLQGRYAIEVVDVLISPQRALADGVLVTPSLAKLSPAPAVRIVGNLSDRSGVLRALGIEAGAR